MKRKTILVNTSLCYGCFACEVACKQEHGLPVGIHWMRVHTVGPRRVGGKMKMDFYPMHCVHCSRPPCKEVCPEDAITQRADGIVLISEERCIGCLKCVEACPFGAIEYDPESNLVGKCDLCTERIDAGELPACVYHCPTGALQYDDPNELTAEKQQSVADRKLATRA